MISLSALFLCLLQLAANEAPRCALVTRLFATEAFRTWSTRPSLCRALSRIRQVSGSAGDSNCNHRCMFKILLFIIDLGIRKACLPQESDSMLFLGKHCIFWWFSSPHLALSVYCFCGLCKPPARYSCCVYLLDEHILHLELLDTSKLSWAGNKREQSSDFNIPPNQLFPLTEDESQVWPQSQPL